LVQVIQDRLDILLPVAADDLLEPQMPEGGFEFDLHRGVGQQGVALGGATRRQQQIERDSGAKQAQAND
jgi:hypothetical protein